MSQVVSRDSDLLVLVDSEDNEIGLREKRRCHEGRGVLHRAVSAFLFNEVGQLLLQQRQQDKQLWGACWSNSCCTHPYYGERPNVAAERRVREELGLEVRLTFAFKFEYRAEWRKGLVEHELCSVFHGRTNRQPSVNPTEIQAWRWIDPHELDILLKEETTAYTPWLKQEWLKLRELGIPE